MNKICIIGHFGFGKSYSDGQTIKTKILSDELKRRYGKDKLAEFDTEGGRKRILLFPFLILRALLSSENVIILPAQNGLRVIAPLLVLENRILHRKLHYVVIGGWLPEFLRQHKRLTSAVKAFNAVYVETSTMKKALEEQGLENVYVMPNCKRLAILDESELVYSTCEPFGLCTFSRVMKEKGIGDAVDAVKTVNEKFGRTVYTLDIYGQVDSAQTEWFENLKQDFPEYIRYQGIAPYDRTTEILKNYYALLFPTHYFTEGIPGTIVDAFAGGLPVISSKWASFDDVMLEGETGFSCPFSNHGAPTALCERLEYIYVHQSEWNGKKTDCLKQAQKYDVSNAISVLTDNI